VVGDLVQDPEDPALSTASSSISWNGTNNVVTFTDYDEADGRTYGLSVNGTSYTFTPSASDAYDDSAAGYAAGAKAALEAALVTAGETGVTVVAGDTAGDGSGSPTLTITSNLNFSDATSTATTSSANITNGAEASSPSLGEEINVIGPLVAGDSFSITIDGTSFTAVYNESDGYANSTAGVAAQLIAKINDADIAGLTVTDNEDGSFILAKGGALTVDSASNSHAAIAAIDDALQILSGDRAEFGALSNRFTSAISNLTNVAANAEMSLGRLQDADFAAETSKLTTGRILEQASIAMMAQANAAKQNVLQLLG
jgi:flagellin